MCNKDLIFAFLGGAIVGAGVAILCAPQSGEDFRDQVKDLCRKYGLCKCKGEEEVERLVSEIIADVNVSKK